MTGRGAQRAFGGLLARPLVTAASDPELYRAVARHLAEVRDAARTLGYRLASSGQAFRLVRVPVAGAVTAPPPPPDRPGRRVLALICVLAAACAEVNGPAWVRSIVVVATALILLSAATLASRGSRGAFLRLRIISIVTTVAIVVALRFGAPSSPEPSGNDTAPSALTNRKMLWGSIIGWPVSGR